MKCTCNRPFFREGENFCRNCGGEKLSQFTKKSEGGEYTGEVVIRARGYVIIITSVENSDNYHEFKQKDVKVLETRTGLKGQELADLIASKTTSVRYNYNGKYGTSSISYDLRTEEEKEEDKKRKEEALAILEAQKAEKAEAERVALLKRIEEEKSQFDKIDLSKKIKVLSNMRGRNGAIYTGLYEEYTVTNWLINHAVNYVYNQGIQELEFTFNFISYEEMKEIKEKFAQGGSDSWESLLLQYITIYE